MLFYNCTFITLNFIRPVLEKYSRVLFFNTLLYSTTSEMLILYSTLVTIFTSILYSTRVVKYQYFTQHWLKDSEVWSSSFIFDPFNKNLPNTSRGRGSLVESHYNCWRVSALVWRRVNHFLLPDTTEPGLIRPRAHQTPGSMPPRYLSSFLCPFIFR